MSAEHYKLRVSTLTGKVYIAKAKSKGSATHDKSEVSKAEFLAAIIHWAFNEMDEDKDCGVTVFDENDKEVMAITLSDDLIKEMKSKYRLVVEDAKSKHKK